MESKQPEYIMTDESSNDIGHYDTIAEEQQFENSDNKAVKKKWSSVNLGYTEFKVMIDIRDYTKCCLRKNLTEGISYEY